jgi:hypothetical protein
MHFGMEQALRIKLTDDENLKISHDSLVEVIRYLNSNLDTEKSIALINLFEEILRELTRFTLSRNDLTETSLQVRNIFELYLITKHVNFDPKGLSNWCGQGHKDITEINNGFIRLLSRHNEDVTGLQEAQNFIDEQFSFTSYQSKGSFNIRDLAKKYGYDDDYVAIHKLCSKLVHPSSIKVNGYNALTENCDYINVLIHVAVYFCQKIEKLASEIKNA